MTPQQAIAHFGTQAKLARSLGLAQSTVAEWSTNLEIPIARQYQIELATLGALRADIPALREQAA
jgi:DNA-binding transcriptional regulator YdaS (Cro superfamily)